MEDSIILSDAHTHMGTEAEMREREEKGIVSLVCVSTPQEADMMFSRKRRYLIPTCGVHPWHGAIRQVKELEEWMERCPVIGEIGMDSVWCQVPLDVQKQVFMQQLEMACRQKKAVILHTKGQEQAIARIIKDYPNRYLVHWYSCQDHLEEYLDQDCYFSLGPDVWWNQAVMQVAKKVPRHRLLVETDGLSSVRWAFEEGCRALGEEKPWKDTGVQKALTAAVETAAEILGIPPRQAGSLFKENLVSGFMGGKV